MNCRGFENDQADWVAGRLPEKRARQMEAHRALCSTCTRSASFERDLRVGLQDLPVPAGTPDVWPRLVASLPALAPARRSGIRHRWGLSGACAVALVLFAMWFRFGLPTVPASKAPNSGQVVDEQQVVRLVAQIRGPALEDEILLNKTRAYRHPERDVLLGIEER